MLISCLKFYLLYFLKKNSFCLLVASTSIRSGIIFACLIQMDIILMAKIFLGRANMFRNSVLLILFLFPLITIKTAQSKEFSLSTSLGYENGPGIRTDALIGNFARQFPFKIRLGFGYTSIPNPGKALAARKIFINDATNGRPEKHGWSWNFAFDLLHRVHWFKLPNAYFYVGPRYTAFTANFDFVNGNEDFNVISKTWGFGFGLITLFSINKHFALSFESGMDYFFPSKLYGHDTSYSPDNDNVNPRKDFTYKDADQAINQPKLRMNFLIGLRYYF